MNFKKVLKNGCYLPDLKSENKQGIIEEMIDYMVAVGKISDRQAVLDAVLERENKMSTGMQHGVAIPHGKTASVEDLVVAFALKKDGVDFNSIDGELSRIFIMTISSSNRTGPHIQYLSEISKLLNSPSIRESLLSCGSKEEIIKILTE
ncbi:PTS sugar transporter subunit IIA [Verrucomicrobiota bacterium]